MFTINFTIMRLFAPLGMYFLRFVSDFATQTNAFTMSLQQTANKKVEMTKIDFLKAFSEKGDRF